MSSLYRQYRPQTFEEIFGQDHISQVLQSSLKKGSISHAYLFAGPRGTGKTTLARILAKAVNCLDEKDRANPCNHCPICLEINKNQSMDVVEIDAASNRGIDEIRDLRDKVAYAATRSRYKVYIIDEVHMLTKEAFNALLKTLEEPPSHVIFILATTEIHKLPETILSRCLRFYFRRANQSEIKNLLEKVAQEEKINLETETIELLANRAEGSYRDSLTLLTSLASVGGKVNAQQARELLGLPAENQVQQVFQALQSGQSAQLLTLFQQTLAQGGDLTILVKAVADHIKNLILSGQEQTDLGSLAALLEELNLTLARVRTASDPTAVLAARLISLGQKSGVKNPVTANLVVPTLPLNNEAPTVIDLQSPAKNDEPLQVDSVSSSATKTGDQGSFWSQFLEKIKAQNHALYAVLRSAQLENLTETKLVIAVRFRFYIDRLTESRNRKIIETTAQAVSGKNLLLECLVNPSLASAVKEEDDLMKTVVNVFELEDVANG